MNDNPYAAPDDLNSINVSVTPITDDAPSVSPLHPLSGVVAATILGTSIAGAIVIAISLSRLGRRNTAIKIVGVSLTLLLLLIMSAFFVFWGRSLDDVADDVIVKIIVITLLQPPIMYLLGKILYGRELETRRRAGGRIASAWKGAALGYLFLNLFVIVSTLIPKESGLQSLFYRRPSPQHLR